MKKKSRKKRKRISEERTLELLAFGFYLIMKTPALRRKIVNLFQQGITKKK